MQIQFGREDRERFEAAVNAAANFEALPDSRAHWKAKRNTRWVPNTLIGLERETGFEPATPTLAR